MIGFRTCGGNDITVVFIIPTWSPSTSGFVRGESTGNGGIPGTGFDEFDVGCCDVLYVLLDMVVDSLQFDGCAGICVLGVEIEGIIVSFWVLACKPGANKMVVFKLPTRDDEGRGIGIFLRVTELEAVLWGLIWADIEDV